MTQERNNSYAFVLEDPSKPRKYQLNFQPSHIQPTMDQSLPQHHHTDLPRPQITLPSIKELMQMPPSPVPPPSLPPSSQQQQRLLQQHQFQQQQQQHHHHHQQHHQQQQQQYLQHHNIHQKTDSLTSSSRPHLPPLQPSQPSLETTPSNLNNYLFNTPSRNDNRNDSHLQLSHQQHSQQQQQQHSPHSLSQHQHPLIPPSSDVSSYYSPHSSSSSYPSHSTNSQYPVNHKIPPPQHHAHYQPPSHQVQQVLPQQIQHQHHHHHHHQQPPPPSQPQPQPPPPSHLHHIHHQPSHPLQMSQPQPQQQQQQQVPQGYHHHHHPPSSHHHHPPPHMYNNDVVPERSQLDNQSSVAASRAPYNSHPYYSQVSQAPQAPQAPQVSHVYPNPQMMSSAQSHATSRNFDYPVRDAPPSGPLLNGEQHHHHQQNGVSGHMQQYPPPHPHPQHIQHHPQIQQPPLPQQQPQPQSQPPSLYMQHHHQQQKQQPPPPQVSHLQVPPPNISRSLTPPQLNLPPQQPQSQFLPENRETSPSHLLPPSHHHSGSNSSVSTRSSSPAPSTPIASNNLPFSSNGGNTINNNMDKPAIEQSAPVKKRGRSKPRNIAPAGPTQQSNSTTQSPSPNASSDTFVIVHHYPPNSSTTSNNNNNNTLLTKPPQTSRSRKNSVSPAPSTTRRGRKAKDSSSSSSAVQAKVIEGVNYNSDTTSSLPENNEKNTLQSRKREYPSSTDNQNSKKHKKNEEVHVIHDDDVVMEGTTTTHNEKGESKMEIEEAELLLSLKDNGTNTNLMNNVADNTVAANKLAVEPVKDIKIKEENLVKVVTPIVEPIVNELKYEKNSADEQQVDQSTLTRKVKEMSIEEDDEKHYHAQGKKFPKSPKKFNDNTIKYEISEKKSTRVVTTSKFQDKRERPKLTSIESDSDSDLAMDDGMDDGDDNKNKQPEHNFNTGVQWNSDDMETEEEVEEEIVTNSVVTKEHDNKQNIVDSSPYILPLNVTKHKKSNESVKETNTNMDSSNKKSSLPISPTTPCLTTTNNGTLSRKASTSSSISRKGSTSSNGSNKEKDNVIYGSPIEAPIASPPPLVRNTATDAGNSTTTITNGNSNNNNTKSQRPGPPRRRSTMRDDEKLELNAIEWEKNIEIPHDIWMETLRVFEIVKHSKEMKNRQPHRKRNHILASILFILCRQNGLPRTFVEICNAASIRKQEIGTYYRLMLKVFESNGLGDGSNGTVDSAEYLKRWCQNLKLPSHILNAAIHVYRQASELNITTGKCPVSVGAASIWLSIHSWNEIRQQHYSHTHTDDAEFIKVEHKDVAVSAGVVNATLVGCFKNLLKFKETLLPEGFLKEAKERSPYYLKPSTLSSSINNNKESDSYGQVSSSLDNVKYYGSPTNDSFDNCKPTGETATIESKVESISKPVKSEPVSGLLKSPTKVQVKNEKNETNTQSLKSPVEVETLTNVDKAPIYKKEVKIERISPPRVIKPIPEIEPGQEDADDELEEGELREDDDDMMMD